MTYAAVSAVGDNTLGKYLKIVSQNGVYSQLSQQSAAWDRILKRKKGPQAGREHRFLLRQSYGLGAAQFVAVNGAVSYPAAHQAVLAEGTALFKDFALTIEVERTLIAKALADANRYGEPLAEEIKCKTIGMARMLSAAVYQDGTGRIGEVSSAAVVNTTQLRVTLATGTDSIGHVGFFEYGDKVKFVSSAGAAQVPTVASGTPAYATVAAVDRVNDTVDFNFYSSADALLDVDAANEIGSGDFIIRYGITGQDYANIGTSNDYATASEAFVGLHSLYEDDNRKVNGVNLTGVTKGTRYGCGGQPIDSQHFQAGMSLLKVAVGEGAYTWDAALMAPEVMDSLVESRETDRRFISLTDNKRGVASLGVVHGRSTVMFETDEYCPKKRIYVLPKGDSLIFMGSTFEWVKPDGGQKFFLRPNTSGGHYRSVRAYMEGGGTLFTTHPAAALVLENFTF